MASARTVPSSPNVNWTYGEAPASPSNGLEFDQQMVLLRFVLKVGNEPGLELAPGLPCR